MSAKLFLLMVSAFSAYKAHQDIPKLSSLKASKSGKKKAGGSKRKEVEMASSTLLLTKHKFHQPLPPQRAILTKKNLQPVFPPVSTKSPLIYNPVKGARMSSQFGYRCHPILKTRKLHKGMDFAAPIGTPVRAAADGKIIKARYNGGYGRYIRIQHTDGSIHTAYAHLTRYKKGLKQGQYVKKNEIIGYVGTTGRSTGPHLHFELIKNGKHVNPRHFMV